MILHSDDSRKFKCTVEGCLLAFSKKYTLQNHILTHNIGEKPLRCHYEGCGMAFIQNNVLQRHLKSCHGQKFYKCDYCNEAFFDKKAELRVHWTECDRFISSRF